MSNATGPNGDLPHRLGERHLMANNSGYSFATWTSFIEESQIRALLKYKVKYYFAGGLPGIMPTKIFGQILKDLGQKYHRTEWGNASSLFVKSGELIVKLCEKALTYDGRACSEFLGEIADTEEEAYKFLV